MIDPTHPLFGRRFAVISVSRSKSDSAIVTVRFRDGITLRIPLRVTNISGLVTNSLRATLTDSAVREFLELVKEYQSCPKMSENFGTNSPSQLDAKSSKN